MEGPRTISRSSGTLGACRSTPAPHRSRAHVRYRRGCRQAVLDHVATEHRRTFCPVVHVGEPGEGAAALVVARPPGGPQLDHALRTDAIEAMTRSLPDRGGVRVPLVWVTRSGTLEVRDDDLAWASATASAGSELGVDLSMVVVTRRGWIDPRTGASRTWRRLRPPRRQVPGGSLSGPVANRPIGCSSTGGADHQVCTGSLLCMCDR